MNFIEGKGYTVLNLSVKFALYMVHYMLHYIGCIINFSSTISLLQINLLSHCELSHCTIPIRIKKLEREIERNEYGYKAN